MFATHAAKAYQKGQEEVNQGSDWYAGHGGDYYHHPHPSYDQQQQQQHQQQQLKEHNDYYMDSFNQMVNHASTMSSLFKKTSVVSNILSNNDDSTKQHKKNEDVVLDWMFTSAANAAATCVGATTARSNRQEGMILNQHANNSSAGITTKLLDKLRPYFSVTNEYVAHKMKRLLFPYPPLVGPNQWERKPKQQMTSPFDGNNNNGNQQTICDGSSFQYYWQLPHSDCNAPDMYIPTMSLMTFVLLCGLRNITIGKNDDDGRLEFHPQILSNLIIRCVLVQGLEILVYYGLNKKNGGNDVVVTFILDTFCYTGYKYFGLAIYTGICKLMMGCSTDDGNPNRKLYFPILLLLWMTIANSYFLWKSLNLKHSSQGSPQAYDHQYVNPSVYATLSITSFTTLFFPMLSMIYLSRASVC